MYLKDIPKGKAYLYPKYTFKDMEYFGEDFYDRYKEWCDVVIKMNKSAEVGIRCLDKTLYQYIGIESLEEHLNEFINIDKIILGEL
jgi:hypothetical protein